MSTPVKLEEGDTHMLTEEEENLQPSAVSSSTIDPVVREIPVHLSPALAQQLYLLQYPLEHANSRHHLSPHAARIKPRHGMLQMDHSLPTSLMDSSAENKFSHMTERTFDSHTIPLQTHMCLGKLATNTENESVLHLVPLTHLCQMRPSLQHVDQMHALETTSNTTSASSAAHDDSGKADTKPLAFSRKESDRAAMIRKSSYNYKKTSEDSEEWIDLQVQSEPQASNGIVEQIVRSTDPTDLVRHDVPLATSREYIQSLNYMPPLTQEATAGSTAAGPSQIADVASVAIRLTQLLRLGYPTPFCILQQHFAAKDTALIKALQVCAIQVHGNYCLNSKFMATLTPAKKKVRTFILLLLQERACVERERLIHVFRGEVTPEAQLVLLNQVARKAYRGWCLKIDADQGHVQDYLDNTQAHQAYWVAQKKRFAKELTRYDEVVIQGQMQ